MTAHLIMINAWRKKKQERPLLGTIASLVFALAGALLIQAFVIKPFKIPSESMVPTLVVGERILVERVSYRFNNPQRGDVIVFRPPIGSETDSCFVEHRLRSACPMGGTELSRINFIKRIVAEPGDQIAIKRGKVYLNGKQQKEPFINNDPFCPICNLPEKITVPKGHYFVMGDNRGQSTDSRVWGPVPRDAIIGKTVFSYWPPSRFGPFE